jgi:hypothetical protein
MHRIASLLLYGFVVSSVAAQVSVPSAVPDKAKTQSYRDSKYGVRFDVPPGWDLSKKDHQLSTFRLDAHSAKGTTRMRAVASLGYNPFPQSTLSGASLYYSVEPRSTDRECEVAARGKAAPAEDSGAQSIGGVMFTHGHEEHGRICMESRDDVYTAFRKGSCYRFDLTVNMFCSEVSGAQEITLRQMQSVEAQMAGILSTVALDWSKTGAETVDPPAMVAPEEPASPKAPLATSTAAHTASL